jgi:hypothetical protein
MLYEEAKWIGNQLTKICKPNSKLLNIGSSSLHSRTIAQPHMEEFIFAPLRNQNVKIIHTDIQDIEGVDLVGDLTDASFVKKLELLNIDCVLCSNLLEHILEKRSLIKAIESIISKGGYGVITVPFVYPYHLDPIDTMFRPKVNELSILFEGLSTETGEYVAANRVFEGRKESNYFQMMKNSPEIALRILLRCFLPFYKFKIWKYTVTDLLKMFKPFQVTCIVLKKTN